MEQSVPKIEDSMSSDLKPQGISETISRAYEVDRFRQQGHALIDRLAQHLENCQNRLNPSSYPAPEPESEKAFWSAWLQEHRGNSSGLANAIEQTLIRANQLQDPRYMGHQVAVSMPSQALVGMVTDLLNNGQAIYEMGPSNAALEELLMAEIGEAMGLPAGCGGILCHGGTLGNLVALMAAQRQLGLRQGTDVWTEGIAAAEPVAVLVSDQAHYCVDRAVRTLGWGRDAIFAVETDKQHRMDMADLERKAHMACSEGRTLLAVVGSACTTSTGAFDPLASIGQWAKKNKIWFHVDGAHGAPVAFSKRHRHLVQGIEEADSVVMDFHKLCSMPALCTGVFYREQEKSFLPFLQQAEYLWSNPDEQDWWDHGKRTLECTKRMLSSRLLALRSEFGWSIWGDLVDQMWDITDQFANEIERRSGWQLAIRPQANIVCFRPTQPAGIQPEQMNQIRSAYLATGSGYIVATILDGQPWFRCTFMNPLTQTSDFKRMLNELEETIASVVA